MNNIALIVVFFLLACFHGVIIFFSIFCMLQKDINAFNKVQSFLVFISIFPVFISDIIVSTIYLSPSAGDLYNISLILDVLSVILYQVVFCNWIVGRSSQIFKGLAPQFHENFTYLLAIKAVFSLISAIVGLIICQLINVEYTNVFLCTYYGIMSSLNLSFAISVKLKLTSLQLVFRNNNDKSTVRKFPVITMRRATRSKYSSSQGGGGGGGGGGLNEESKDHQPGLLSKMISGKLNLSNMNNNAPINHVQYHGRPSPSPCASASPSPSPSLHLLEPSSDSEKNTEVDDSLTPMQNENINIVKHMNNGRVSPMTSFRISSTLSNNATPPAHGITAKNMKTITAALNSHNNTYNSNNNHTNNTNTNTSSGRENQPVTKTEFERFTTEFRKYTIGTLANISMFFILAAFLLGFYADGTRKGGLYVSLSWKIMAGMSSIMSQIIVYNMRGLVGQR